MRRLPRLRRILARALFTWAALIFSLAPSIDSMAGAAAAAVEAGHSSSILTAVAAFDVVDDTLDHLPGKGAPEAQQQVVLSPVPPVAIVGAVPSMTEARCGWAEDPVRPLASRSTKALERPPRT